jgi:hypothetical protein
MKGKESDVLILNILSNLMVFKFILQQEKFSMTVSIAVNLF